MNFVMRCLVPPGDVNQLTINAGYRESTHIRINDFRLYREISDGKSITYMIAGLNKEYGDVVESGLLFADPAVVDRETDELIEKAIAFKLAYRQQYQQKAGWNYEPSFC